LFVQQPDTGYYPSVSVRERRRFVDVMDEEIDDEKRAEHPRSQPMRLIRELGAGSRTYGRLQTIRSEVANSRPSSCCELGLQAEIPYFRLKLKEQTLPPQSDCILTVVAAGDPAPDITWFKNDCILLPGGRFSVESDVNSGKCELKIERLHETDGGCYKCLARNDHGAVVCRARLNVSDGAPTPVELSQKVEPNFADELRDTPLLSADQISERFELLTCFDRGQFGVVLHGTDRESSSKVSIKIASGDGGQTRNEIELLSTLCHENVLKLLHVCEQDSAGCTWFVSEPLAGEHVLQYLSQLRTYNEQLVVRLVGQLVDAIEYLHFRGWCAVQVRPDSLALVRLDQPTIKLMNLSQARRAPSPQEAIEQAQAKTQFKLNALSVPQWLDAEFVAPEVLRNEPISYAADVWNVGVIAYLLLSAVSPFRAGSESETVQNVNFVRFRFELLYKEVSQEAIRFLMLIFKRMPE
jgi:hypothetical protein